jgi:hypothetical protein
MDESGLPPLRREGFYFRFSARSPRDVQLAAWLDEDMQAGDMNVSAVIKDLLYGWYLQRHQLGAAPLPILGAGPIIELGAGGFRERENPDDPLVQSLLNVNFDGV